jgi:hypothetical protein
MPVNSPLLLKLLAGEVPSCPYGDLEAALKGTKEFTKLDSEGPHRYWAHPMGTGILMVRSEDAAPMYPRYVERAGKYLREVQANGGLQ